MKTSPVAWMTCVAAAAALFCTAFVSPAEANDWSRLVPLKRADPNAVEGAEPKDFALGPDAISFSTLVPNGATVETARLGEATGNSGDGPGDLKVVGKVRLAEANGPIESTIVALRLKSPPAASLLCEWGLGDAGYTLSGSDSAPGLAEAHALGFKVENGRRAEGALLACFTRGDLALTVLTVFDLRGAKTAEDAKRITDTTRSYAGLFLSNITFADGAPSGFAPDRMTELSASIGEDRLTFSVPDAFRTQFNDFKGQLPAELALLSERDGKPKGLIWLAAQERSEPDDLETLGAKLVRDWFAAQSPDMKAADMLFTGEDPTFKAAGAASRSFRFSVESKTREEAGDLLGAICWKDGRLYVSAFWSRWAPANDRVTFFSRLPGLTAYDRMRISLLAFLSKPPR